ncbi:hypothetical protein [Staphylococcus hominis]|uniref:hypothetical protein n=1 Tax=Staphylococcus hominis TaxID=1290 RepID=UPI0010F67804|nr:hypothetical protein [Staphylococcus hominis]UQA64336.1 hypothetical protein Sta0113_06745 [Staphylococcus hominis subsp. hominis]
MLDVGNLLILISLIFLIISSIGYKIINKNLEQKNGELILKINEIEKENYKLKKKLKQPIFINETLTEKEIEEIQKIMRGDYKE